MGESLQAQVRVLRLRTRGQPPSPMPRLLPAIVAAALLHPGLALAQIEPGSPAPTSTPAAGGGTPAPSPAVQTPPSGGTQTPPGEKPTSAQQAVLDRIRRLRDGDLRRFGTCSYRWDRWKLQADGTRTTTYSCEDAKIVDRTIGVNCGKLQINSYDPLPKPNDKGEAWAWGSWRLPQAGGEEQMVATLCANVLPQPQAKPAAGAAATPGQPAATKPQAGANGTPASGR